MGVGQTPPPHSTPLLELVSCCYIRYLALKGSESSVGIVDSVGSHLQGCGFEYLPCSVHVSQKCQIPPTILNTQLG